MKCCRCQGWIDVDGGECAHVSTHYENAICDQCVSDARRGGSAGCSCCEFNEEPERGPRSKIVAIIKR